MDRRTFVKMSGAVVLSAPFILQSPIEVVEKIDYTPLNEVYEKIFITDDWSVGTVPEYPLDLLSPDIYYAKDPSYTITKPNRIPERLVEGDYIVVPTMKFDSYEQETISAMDLISVSAIDRNITVFDSDADSGILTKRMIAILKSVMQRNGNPIKTGRLDVLLVDKDIKEIDGVEIGKQIKCHGVDIIRTDMSSMMDIAKKVDMTLPDDKKSMVVGISLTDHFVRAKADDKVGLAVLNHKSVILGAI
jgi:hypothetical protein